MLLSDLPVELVNEILAYALRVHPTPSSILAVNSAYLWLGLPLLQCHMRFRSAAGLASFVNGTFTTVCIPRTVTVDLSGGNADFQVFESLRIVLSRFGCHVNAEALDAPQPLLGLRNASGLLEAMESPRTLGLEEVFLRLHSHAQNPNLANIYRALVLIKCGVLPHLPVLSSDLKFLLFSALGNLPGRDRIQITTSPSPYVSPLVRRSPSLTSSAQIVPDAAAHLLRAACTWTNLRHLVLTNISFSPTTNTGAHLPDLPPPEVADRPVPLIPAALPSLETLLISQATFLPASAVAAMLALPGMERLARVRLVDAYEESIWERRLRRGAVERAAGAVVADSFLADLHLDAPCGADVRVDDENDGMAREMSVEMLRSRIRRIVVCEARTERIMGGDRVEGTAVFE